MIRLISIALAALGVWSLVDFGCQLDVSNAYAYEIPVRSLAVGLLQLATAWGLLARRSFARSLLLGACVLGMTWVFVFPVIVYFAAPKLLFLLLVFRQIGLEQFAKHLANFPTLLGVTVVVSGTASYLFYRLFRRLRSDDARKAFAAEASGTIQTTKEPLAPVFVAVGVWVAAAILPGMWSVGADHVPSVFKNRAMRGVDIQLDGMRAIALTEHSVFSADEKTVFFFPRKGDAVLVALDVATGQVTRTAMPDLSQYGLLAPDGHIVVAGRNVYDVGNEQPRILKTLAGRGQRSEGFIEPRNVLTKTAPMSENAGTHRIELVNLEADSVIYAHDVPGDQGSVAIWSADRSRYGWLTTDGLVVLTTESGELVTAAATCLRESGESGIFSREADLVYAQCRKANDPHALWAVFDLTNGTAMIQAMKRGHFLFASRAGDVALYVERELGEPAQLVQYHARDVTQADWAIPLPSASSNVVATLDGRTIFVGHGQEPDSRPAFARLSPDRSQAPRFETLPALLTWGDIKVSPSGKLILLTYGPFVEVMDVDGLDDGKPGVAVELATGRRITQSPKIVIARPN